MELNKFIDNKDILINFTSEYFDEAIYKYIDYRQGCSMCHCGDAATFVTNVEDVIIKNNDESGYFNLKNLKIKEIYAKRLTAFWTCTQKNMFDIIKNYNRKLDIGKVEFKNHKYDEDEKKYIDGKQCTLTTCFDKDFSDDDSAEYEEEFNKVEDILICSSCYNWLKILHVDIMEPNNTTLWTYHHNIMRLFWKDYVESILEFAQTSEENLIYLYNKFKLEYNIDKSDKSDKSEFKDNFSVNDIYEPELLESPASLKSNDD